MSQDKIANVLKFIATVELNFPRAKFNGDKRQESAWVETMVEAVGGFSPSVLTAAARHITLHRDPAKTSSTFPKPRECIAVCVEIADSQRASETPLLPPTNANEWSDDRIALAFDLCKTPLGLRAAREGWVKTLHDFCRKNARVPKGPEVDACIRDARLTDEIIDGLRSEQNPTPITGALLKFADTVLERRKEIAEKIIGGAA